MKKNPRHDVSVDKTDTFHKNLNKFINSIKIDIPILTKKELIRISCLDYNKHLKTLDNYSQYKLANPQQSPEEFIKRICLNYLRHKLSDYEDDIKILYGFYGYEQGYKKLKLKFNKEIVKHYNWLK